MVTLPPMAGDADERAREKQASRDQDAADLASGAKTREQLHAENAAFAGLRVRVKRYPLTTKRRKGLPRSSLRKQTEPRERR